MRQVFLGAFALLAVGGVCALLSSETDVDVRVGPARGSRVVGEQPAAPRSELPLTDYPARPKPEPEPAPEPAPAQDAEPATEPEAKLGTPLAGTAEAGRQARPRPEARSVAELDVFVNPQQLLAHGLIEQGRAVDGIVVTTSVSFSATRLPLGYTRSVLSPLGDYSYLLAAGSTRADPKLPAGMRGRVPYRLRFPPAGYTVTVDLHVKAQHPHVREQLIKTFGYGEDARIPLARGHYLFGGEGGARALRAQTLTTLDTLHPQLERACVFGARAVNGEVRLQEFQARLGQAQTSYQPFVAQLERWVALPDQDLLDVYTGVLETLGEVDTRLREGRGTKQQRLAIYDTLRGRLETLRGLEPKLAKRRLAALGY